MRVPTADATSWETQMRKGLSELCVLAVIARGETHGYAILQTLAASPTLVIGESALYPLLTRLVEAGHAVVESRPSPQGPPRRCYRITASGRYRLQRLKLFHTRQVQETRTLLDAQTHS